MHIPVQDLGPITDSTPDLPHRVVSGGEKNGRGENDALSHFESQLERKVGYK